MIRFSKVHAVAMIAVIGLCSAVFTTAQPPKGEGEKGEGGGDRASRMLERFDKNGDGKIESDEAGDRLWGRLAEMDADGDGAVTADEINDHGAQERKAPERGAERGRDRGSRGGNPLVTALDKDKDGKLSKEEIADASKSLLTLDKNKDGELTADEMRGPRRSRGGERGERGGRDRHGRDMEGMERDAEKKRREKEEKGG